MSSRIHVDLPCMVCSTLVCPILVCPIFGLPDFGLPDFGAPRQVRVQAILSQKWERCTTDAAGSDRRHGFQRSTDKVYFDAVTSSGTRRKEESNGFAMAEFLSGIRSCGSGCDADIRASLGARGSRQRRGGRPANPGFLRNLVAPASRIRAAAIGSHGAGQSVAPRERDGRYPQAE